MAEKTSQKVDRAFQGAYSEPQHCKETVYTRSCTSSDVNHGAWATPGRPTAGDESSQDLESDR